LLVIVLIAILVTIIVGVAKKVSGTRSSERTHLAMTQILDAIEAYSMNDPNHAPPEDSARIAPTPKLPGWSLQDWQAFNRGFGLYQDLGRNAVSAGKLPTGDGSTAGFVILWPVQLTRYDALADGFRKFMDYRDSGGVGGTPLLISAGPDGKFGTQDDIRSDRR
jgi:type II secretory pathway pseudopilin PulG